MHERMAYSVQCTQSHIRGKLKMFNFDSFVNLLIYFSYTQLLFGFVFNYMQTFSSDFKNVLLIILYSAIY